MRITDKCKDGSQIRAIISDYYQIQADFFNDALSDAKREFLHIYENDFFGNLVMTAKLHKEEDGKNEMEVVLFHGEREISVDDLLTYYEIASNSNKINRDVK